IHSEIHRRRTSCGEPDCRGSGGRRKPGQDGERRSGQRHREEPGCCTYTEQASQKRKVHCQKRCRHADWRGQHSSSARHGRKGRVSSSKREAGGERAAGEEREGHVVEGTVSSVHLLQREPSEWVRLRKLQNEWLRSSSSF